MHATTEQLLSLRDGEPVPAGVAAHVDGCAHCARELVRLGQARDGLRRLPRLEPPPSAWQEVLLRAAPSPVSPAAGRYRPRPAVPAALAASAVLALALLLATGERETGAPLPGTTTDLVASTPAPASSVNGAAMPELVERSRRLESALRAMPAAPRVTRTGTALAVAELQDGIFEIDSRLSARDIGPEHEQALWRQRVDLMDALMQVRYAELADAR